MKQIEDKLEQLSHRTYFEAASAIRPAAILIPLIEKDEELHLLFEVRSSKIPQGGDICFPGGAMEDGETPIEAAIRETKEELFVTDSQISDPAPMHLLQGPGGKMVYSVFARLHDYDGRYSTDEVDHVFTVPLRFFLDRTPFTYDSKIQSAPDDNFPYARIQGGRNYKMKNSLLRRYYFYELPEGKLWGLTAEAVFRFTETLRK